MDQEATQPRMAHSTGHPAVPSVTSPIILIDGTCHFCTASVRWIAARDRRGVCRFAALQSELAQQLIADAHARAQPPLPDSMIFLDGTGVWWKSEAVLRLCAILGWPWSLVRLFRIVPRSWRDWLYDFVAARRHRWFGTSDQCIVPTDALRSRILIADRPDAKKEDGTTSTQAQNR